MIGERKIKRIINQEFRKTLWYKNLWKGAEKFWANPPFDLDIINLGSGAAYFAYNYEGIGVKGCNWALWPQSLQHDFNILKNYYSFIKPKGYVVITACPFGCLYSPNYDKNHNLKYYTFLHPATIQNFDEDERLKALLLKENPLAYIGIKKVVKKIIKDKWVKPNHSITSEQYVDDAHSMIEGWKKQFGIDDLDAPLSNKHKLEFDSRQKLLREMIQFCLERDLRPVIVYPPIHPSLYALMSEKFIKRYIYDFIEGAISGLDCAFYEFLNSEKINSDDMFRTSYFLNTKGAKVFTSELIKLLRLLQCAENKHISSFLGGGKFIVVKKF